MNNITCLLCQESKPQINFSLIRKAKNLMRFVCDSCQQIHRTPTYYTQAVCDARNRGRFYNVKVCDLTPLQWLRKAHESKGQCFYCQETVGIKYIHLEHVRPLCKQGRNTIENVVAACVKCNRKKLGKIIGKS